jgi:hypothetical protein
MKQDATFSDTAAYGSDAWCAATLGKSLNWFKTNRPVLEREGFPKKDGLIGQTLKGDVDAWLARRRQVVNAVDVSATIRAIQSVDGENLSAL